MNTEILMIKLFKLTFEDALKLISNIKLTDSFNQYIDLENMEIRMIDSNVYTKRSLNKKGIGSLQYKPGLMTNLNYFMESKITILDQLAEDINWMINGIGVH